MPRLLLSDRSHYPRLDKVNDYLDWRNATDTDSRASVIEDFDEGGAIVSEAWDETVAYVETNWRSHLLAAS